jgi:sulfonate transport system substrate-binding protein
MALIDSEIRGKKIPIDNFILIENINGALKSLENNESEVFFWEKYTTKSHVENGNIRCIGEFVTPWSCFQIIASNNFIEKHADILEKMNQIINFSSKQFMTANNSIEEVSQRVNMQLQDAYNWFYSTEWSTNNQISEKMLENVIVSLMKINSIKHEVPTTNLVSEKLTTLI